MSSITRIILGEGRKKALVIGVSQYEDDGLQPLDFCEEDGRQMYSVLKELGYEITESNNLIGKVEGNRMRDTIVDFFTDRKINSTDTVLFYFTGHGVLSNSGEVCLSSSDIDIHAPSKRGFPFTQLTTMMQECRSKRIVTILDCCYSGSVSISKSDEQSRVASVSKYLETESTKQGEGKCVLSACLGYQEAFATLEGRHSVFTSFLIDGLRGANGKSVDKDGIVTPSSLMDYVDGELDKLPHDKRPNQTPLRKIEVTGKIILAYHEHLRSIDTIPIRDEKFDHVFKFSRMRDRLLKSNCLHPDCNAVYKFHFDISPFPISEKIIKAYSGASAFGGSSNPVLSTEDPLLDSIAVYSGTQFRVDVDPRRVFLGNNTFDLVNRLIDFLELPVIVPTPIWYGYLSQVKYSNLLNFLPKKFKRLSASDLVNASSKLPKSKKILLLNNPNGSTGLAYDRLQLEELADVCRENGIYVISDELYAQSTFNRSGFTSWLKVYPEGSFVTNGIAKSHSAGGYNLAYLVFPEHKNDLREKFRGYANSAGMPISEQSMLAGMKAFEDNEENKEYFVTTNIVNRLMVTTSLEFLQKTIPDVEFIPPDATFNALLHFDKLRLRFHNSNISNCHQFIESLGRHPYHTWLMPGTFHFLDNKNYAAGISFVDYDGKKAIEKFLTNKPRTISDNFNFVSECAPKIIQGIKNMAKYLIDVDNSANKPQ